MLLGGAPAHLAATASTRRWTARSASGASVARRCATSSSTSSAVTLTCWAQQWWQP
ncbi:MAG: hypothetical protein H6713_15450 [Myxococcales bacterium]|nr:hypothetical protein [Myxococcales bacterium]